MLYRTKMNTLNQRAAGRAWPLTKLNMPVKIIGGPPHAKALTTVFSTLYYVDFF